MTLGHGQAVVGVATLALLWPIAAWLIPDSVGVLGVFLAFMLSAAAIGLVVAFRVERPIRTMVEGGLAAGAAYSIAVVLLGVTRGALSPLLGVFGLVAVLATYCGVGAAWGAVAGWLAERLIRVNEPS